MLCLITKGDNKMKAAVRSKHDSNIKLTCWIYKYQENNNQGYLYVSIKGGGSCAEGIFAIENFDDKTGRKS